MMHEGTFRVGSAYPKDTVLISSEPLTYVLEDWSLVPANSIVMCTPSPTPGDYAVQDVKVIPW